MTLSDAQLDRYARHIVLKEIGGDGQRRLLEASAIVVGAGGIGSPVIQYLAAAGVGRLTVIDHDLVSLSNLQRQTLFTTGDQGHAKTSVALARIKALNPDVVAGEAARIDAANAGGLLESADVVVDGSDNFATRLAVADAALVRRIPLVSASVAQFEGQLAVYRGWEPDKPCYRCLVGSDPGRPEASCSDQGVLGALAGVMGSLAAMEAIRVVTGFGEDSAGKLLLVEALTLRFRTLNLPKDPGCPACGG
ncbi:MAG TPA: HesA/MoeB/ThiF family protein [Allosphingosinicella sp.]|nr:HesA/MoeB/ThiF family protein [Allosphingosinicella sp.]